MDGPDISSTPNPNAQPNFQTTTSAPAENIPAPGQVEYDQNASTLSKSDQQQLLEELYIMMQFPGLYPPGVTAKDLSDIITGKANSVDAITDTAAVTKLQMMYEQTKNDIISTMWENFTKSVREIEKRSKEEHIQKWMRDVAKEGPKSGAEYLAYLLALSSTSRADELSKDGNQGQSGLQVQFNAAFNQWFGNPNGNAGTTVAAVNNSTTISGGLDTSFKVGALASNPDILNEAVSLVGLAAASQFSVSPLADAMLAVGPNTGLPADSQSAAALIAALLYSGARNKADVETLEKAANNAQPPQDMDFAMSFAKNILAIVSHGTEEGASTDKEQAGQNQMIRLMLSVMALNLIYRAGYGGMEGKKEFVDLLKPGGTDDIDPAIKSTIEDLVMQIKNFLPVDEPNRSQVIARLSEYIDSKDSTESMLATSRMFAASLNVRPDILGGTLGSTPA